MLSDNEQYRLIQGDCIEVMNSMPPASVDHAVFSPPFPSVYAYSSSQRDLGNSEDLAHEGRLHLSYFYAALARVLKTGRVALVHVQQIPRMKRSGGKGLHDFRGLNIRLGERAGLIYEYDWLVRRNPQAQAIKTRSRQLQFAGLEADRAKSRGTLCDYLIKFVADGENAVPVDSEGEVSRNDWIEWAEGAWFGIRETATLNVEGTKGEDDTRHICPLQLDIIRRSVRLYSNPGELVFSPFAGIGSEGWVALELGRRFLGIELKDEYYRAAVANLDKAQEQFASQVASLFDGLESEDSPS